MVKSISVALGEPDLYTNALENVHLPFVVEWDDMSEEGQAEMAKYWSPKEVGQRAAEYDDVRREWCSKDSGVARVGLRLVSLTATTVLDSVTRTIQSLSKLASSP